MRKFLALLSALAIIPLAACNITAASIQADEAAVAQTVATIRAGVVLSAATKGNTVALVCGWVGLVNSDANTVSGLVAGAPSAKVNAALSAAGNAISAANSICNVATDPTGITASTLINLWNAYQSAKAAVTSAQVAVGKT